MNIYDCENDTKNGTFSLYAFDSYRSLLWILNGGTNVSKETPIYKLFKAFRYSFIHVF